MSQLRLLLFASLVLLSPCVAAGPPVELRQAVPSSFRFVAFGDTRFTDPGNTRAADPEARQLICRAVAAAKPAFISIGGDIAYNGDNAGDWAVYDRETRAWDGIPVYPAIGNHDLHGSLDLALGNYFRRYPALQGCRFYAVHAGSVLLLNLDSSLDELEGPQGQWLKAQLDGAGADVEFAVLVLHHPPYTSSTESTTTGGHSARTQERALAAYLEERQKTLRPRIVVLSGHVHNYERHVHGGITYYVTGGGGARPYPIQRKPDDLFANDEVNFHYLSVEVAPGRLSTTMVRLDRSGGSARWIPLDPVTVTASPGSGQP